MYYYVGESTNIPTNHLQKENFVLYVTISFILRMRKCSKVIFVNLTCQIANEPNLKPDFGMD